MKLCFSFISAIKVFKGLSSKRYRERMMFLYLAHSSSDTEPDIFDRSGKSEGGSKARCKLADSWRMLRVGRVSVATRRLVAGSAIQR